ncbi:hypothetical protein GCM10010172_65690 [Paractinoplanes ferrugineus]|uniref:Uncharacterized protein n=1 Tax=Paractinoplanes ferrugineus TaxID=113564 RepID=A0A919J2E2_9ACTN|nr:hypothetical protein [Actinoplanes ferrugineus]GIE13270.1 hypothetical protein Afe05nite_51100 [Actinoplanes ferrugineus]
MTQTILPDPYWANMILGRLVHLHVTLVEEQLHQDHRAEVEVLLRDRSTAATVATSLDSALPRHRVFARLLRDMAGTGLAGSIELHELVETIEVSTDGTGRPWSVLVCADGSAAPARNGIARALTHIDELTLGILPRIGLGMIGVGSPPRQFAGAHRETLFLTAEQWELPTADLAELVLAGAARAIVGQWAGSETRAYGLAGLPPSVPALARDFAVGVCTEARRRAGAPRNTWSGPEPVQEPSLPLVSELVRCWWPASGRAQHIFNSPFDYLTSLEPAHARS